MLDIAVIRENPARVKELCLQKNVDVPVDAILNLDHRRRQLLGEVEQIKARRNSGSKTIGKTRDPDERQRLIAEMSGLGDHIAALDSEVREVLKKSASSERRQAVWEASKRVGKAVEADLKELVQLRNEAARKLGFKNFHALQLHLSEQDGEQLIRLFDELDEPGDEEQGMPPARE